MMLLKAIIFSQCILQIIGWNEQSHVSENPLSLNHFWETQHFINGDAHVEDESDIHFFALRERRETAKQGDEETPSACGEEPDMCELNLDDCHHNATCHPIKYTKSFTCTCKNGFTGDGKICEDIDECTASLHRCHGENTECINTNGSYVCLCKKGYTGNGENCKDINECLPENNPCSLNALCNNTVGSFECTCDKTYYGDGKVCTELITDYSSTTVYTKQGVPAVLVCSLNQTVRWKKDGKLVSDDRKRKIFHNVLVINSTEDKDYGEYFCELEMYKGRGIKMNLLKISEGDNGGVEEDSNKFLIPFIIMLILFIIALVVIVYLLVRRKPNLDTTIMRNPSAVSENRYAKNNETFQLDEIDVSNADDYEEPHYSVYNPMKTADEEHQYQSLMNMAKPSEKEENPYELVEPVSTV